MKFTLSWLKEHLDTTASLDEITQALTAIGLEVESVTDNSAILKPFTVAEIKEAKPHPNANKLQLCKVDTGSDILEIVCGAANARRGIKVVLAKSGSVIPTNGMKIKPTEIRGVKSNGMLCSAGELGIGEDGEGIIELPEKAELGDSFAKYLGLDDPVIEIAITPNRGDCLGVYGIARDLAAAGMGKLKPLNIGKIKGNFKSPVAVSIKNKKQSPYYIGRYFKGVKNGQSPEWLQKRLQSIGLTPISSLVDITNFLTFDLGRPAHVYDAGKLKGNLELRGSKEGEKLDALNDKAYELAEGMPVIADSASIIALGGIIGGKATGCDENTTDVFLEIALFAPIAVAEAGRKLQIDTDARYRFERSLDPEFLEQGAEKASQLIMEICGGEVSEPVIAGEKPKPKKSIDFNMEKVRKLLGIEIPKKEIISILESLGFKISGAAKVIKVSPPSWRSDVEGEADLIEEVARIYGYDNIPASPLPRDENSQPALSPAQKAVADAKRILAQNGLTELVTFSFMKEQDAGAFGGRNEKLKLANPISAELDTMRPSILPNLMQAVQKNQARGFENLGLFEIGPVFENTAIDGQKMVAAGLRSGLNCQKNIYGEARPVDAMDAKADAFAALSPYIDARKASISRVVPPWYHPGKSGSIMLGKNVVAYFGEIHPAILKSRDIDGTLVGFEAFLSAAPMPKLKKTTARAKLEISNLQAVNRDFAFIMDENISADEILKAVSQAEKQLIGNISIFDIYAGKNIEEGKKSVAFTVKLQPKASTLTDEEIEAVSGKIIKSIEKLGGVLRS